MTEEEGPQKHDGRGTCVPRPPLERGGVAYSAASGWAAAAAALGWKMQKIFFT